MAKIIFSEIPTWESMFWPEGIPRQFDIPQATFESTMARWAERQPEHLMIVDGSLSLNYDEGMKRVDRITSAILKICRDDKTWLLCGLEGSSGLLLSLAALKLGLSLVFVPSNVACIPNEIEKSIIFVSNEDDKKWKSLIDSSADPDGHTVVGQDTLDIWMTSEGVISLEQREQVRLQIDTRFVTSTLDTGEEKMVYFAPGSKSNNMKLESSYRPSLLFKAVSSLCTFYSIRKQMTSLLVLPLSDELGFFQAMLTLSCGGAIVWLSREENTLSVSHFQSTLEKYKVNLIFDKGKVLDLIISDLTKSWFLSSRSSIWKAALSSLELFLIDGFKPDVHSLKRFQRAIGIPALRIHFVPDIGVVLANHPSWNVVESFGLPICNLEARVVSPWGDPMSPGKDGELAVKGTMVNSSFLHSPKHRPGTLQLGEGNIDEGWIKTAEYFYMDGNGLFYSKS